METKSLSAMEIFPHCRLGVPVVPLNGHGSVEVLDAILQLMPLDSYVRKDALCADGNKSRAIRWCRSFGMRSGPNR